MTEAEEMNYEALEEFYNRFMKDIGRDFSRIQSSIRTYQANMRKMRRAAEILAPKKQEEPPEAKIKTRKLKQEPGTAIMPVNTGLSLRTFGGRFDSENMRAAREATGKAISLADKLQAYEDELHSIADNKRVSLNFRVEITHSKAVSSEDGGYGATLAGEYFLKVVPYSLGKHIALSLRLHPQENPMVKYLSEIEIESRNRPMNPVEEQIFASALLLNTSKSERTFEIGRGSKHRILKDGTYMLEHYTITGSGLAVYNPVKKLTEEELERFGTELRGSREYLESLGIYVDFTFTPMRERAALLGHVDTFNPGLPPPEYRPLLGDGKKD